MQLRNWVLAALFTALTAVGCLIKIPTPISSFSPLFFFTALSALLLGPKFGALSQGMYVALGLLGLPIFTTGGGIGSIFTTTFGFLLGLIPAAAVIGLLVKRWGTSFQALCAASTAGLLVLYAVGLPYMHLILTVYLERTWTIRQTIVGGMVLFLPWDAVKIVAAAGLARRVLPVMGLYEASDRTNAKAMNKANTPKNTNTM